MLVLSFDVGVRNLAFCLARCALEWPLADTAAAATEGSEEATAAERHLARAVRAKRAVVANTDVLALSTIDTTRFVRPGVSTQNASKIPVLELGRAVLRGLDATLGPALAAFDAPDAGAERRCVVIENQPVLKNPAMKSVQMVIFTHFVRRYIDEPGVDVRMFQARDKLGVYTGEPVPCTLKSAYSRRKRLSVEYTRRLMSGAGTTGALATFEASKKKDDLADCYLQALTFVYQQVVPTKVRRAPPKRKKKKKKKQPQQQRRSQEDKPACRAAAVRLDIV